MRIKIQTIWLIPYHFQLYTQTLGLFSSILELWGGKDPPKSSLSSLTPTMWPELNSVGSW